MPRNNPQSSLLHTPSPGSNLPEWSVSEASKLLKKTVEETFGLVRIRGEISELKIPGSGHMYLTLKDEEAVLAAVCWRGQTSQLGIKPEIGMEVVATGRLTTYMGQSKYQLIIEGLAVAGIGALLKLLEERKKKLAKEGLFDSDRKRPLPFLPRAIGVITSPSGAVIRDILHRVSDRFPIPILLWPVAVQGEGAAEQITAAIEGFNRLIDQGTILKPDVLIVARGGGSVEDLMPFNEEIVVRAAAASKIPLISAVGHETDTTLIDLASDLRAPTPSAAAEMAVPVRDDLISMINDYDNRLFQALRRITHDVMERLALLSRALGDPVRMLEPLLQRFDERSERLDLAWRSYFDRYLGRLAEAAGKLRHPRDLVELARERLLNLDHRMSTTWREIFLEWHNRVETMGALLNNLSPRAVLGRGYVIVKSDEGVVLTKAHSTQANQTVTLEFQDGSIGAIIKKP